MIVSTARDTRGGSGYEQRILAAERHLKVPAGKQITLTRLSWTEARIDLVDGPSSVIGIETITVPTQISKYHAAVRNFREKAICTPSPTPPSPAFARRLPQNTL